MCGSLASDYTVLGKRLNTSQGVSPQNKIGITTSIVKCKTCNLIFSNPQPIPSDIADHYGVPPEDYWKDEYFIEDNEYFETEIEVLKKLIKINENSKALDIGAGIGKCMSALNKNGFISYGFEPSEPFYRCAIEKMKIEPSKLKLASIENVEYSNNEFDFITFGAVLEHLYNPSDSIVKALKWLKPGGIMHIEVPSSHWLVAKIINFAYKIRGMDYVSNISPMHKPYHLYEFGLKSFLLNGKKNDYEVIQHNYYVCETYMPKIVDFVIKPWMKYTNTGMQLVVWIKKNETK